MKKKSYKQFVKEQKKTDFISTVNALGLGLVVAAVVKPMKPTNKKSNQWKNPELTLVSLWKLSG